MKITKSNFKKYGFIGPQRRNTFFSKNIAQSAISFNGEWPVLDNPIVEVLGDN